ncbi:MAG: hypothetical protein AAGD11_02975 [Planctomycetota bacterium]
MTNRTDESERDNAPCLHRLERQVDKIASWLGAELGYEANSEGNLNRKMNEMQAKAAEALSLLRGENDQVGLVGKVELLFRSWHILLSLVAALGGYIVRLVTES